MVLCTIKTASEYGAWACSVAVVGDHGTLVTPASDSMGMAYELDLGIN